MIARPTEPACRRGPAGVDSGRFDDAADAHRGDDGHARVHGARAVPRDGDRRAHRSVQLLRRALEALYGERPFAGNTMFALTSNVVQGKVREAPANSERAALASQGAAPRAAADARRALPVDGRAAPGAGEEPGRPAAKAGVQGRAALLAVGARLRGAAGAGQSPARSAAADRRDWPASGSCARPGRQNRRGKRAW